MGYQVVLFMDELKPPNDYEIPNDVPRIILLNYESYKQSNYENRAKIIKHTIKKYGIDLMIYHEWMSKLL